MQLSTYERAAARGAELLDEHLPGWHKKVKITKLDMGHPGRCVFGQLFADDEYDTFGFEAGARWFKRLRPRDDEPLAKFGFDRPCGMPYDWRWDLLTKAWGAEIRKREEAARG